MSTECRSTTHRPPGSAIRRASGARRRSKTMRRITGSLALLFGADRHRASPTPPSPRGHEPTRTPPSVDAAQIARGQGRSTRRPASPATARTCRVCSTAARRWSGSARPPPTSRCPPAGCRPPRTARRCQRKEPFFNAGGDRRAGRLHPGQRRRPGDPATVTCAHRDADRQGRRAVPAQLRVLPQLHRPGRRALAGQVRARTWTRPPTGRSTAPCSAARRTCPSSVTAS